MDAGSRASVPAPHRERAMSGNPIWDKVRELTERLKG